MTTVSFEVAEKLKRCGWPQNDAYAYDLGAVGHPLARRESIATYVSAPTLAELQEILPKDLHTEIISGVYHVTYINYEQDMKQITGRAYTEEDAAGVLFCELHTRSSL